MARRVIASKRQRRVAAAEDAQPCSELNLGVVVDLRADEHERQVRAEQQAQFKRLKDDAQAIYGMVKGIPGVRTPKQWAELLEKAGDEIGNGRFIVRHLGAERYLEPETVAVLITLRQNLIADLEHTSAADVMLVDAAIVAYFNMLRVQAWIGNLSLTIERELFGQTPLNEFPGPGVGPRLEEQIRRLAEVMLPLQDRAHRMMGRSLAMVRPERKGRTTFVAGLRQATSLPSLDG